MGAKAADLDRKALSARCQEGKNILELLSPQTPPTKKDQISSMPSDRSFCLDGVRKKITLLVNVRPMDV